MLHFLFFILLLVCFVSSQYRFDCDKNYCTKKGNECPALNCEDGRIVKNATTCGCCDIYIRNLKEGEDCITTYYGWSDKIAECGHGLICKKTEGLNGKCNPTECLVELKRYEKEYNVAHHFSASFGCDHFGNFEPVVCLDGVFCFCVDKNGKRIFGTDIAANNDTMKCDCSRDIIDFPKEVDAEYLPRCLPNGNYDPLQCTQNKCFCMESTRYLDDDVVNNTESALKKLSCYSSDKHENGRTTPCLKEREEQMKLFKKENVIVIGVDRIQCELDGTYSPLQCKKGRCFCVSRTGKERNGYNNIIKEDGQLTCRCLRDKEIIQSTGNGKTSYMKDFDKINCTGKYTSDVNVMPGSFLQDFMQ